MTGETKQSSQLIATWAQFVAICIGIGTILVYMGRKDQELAATSAQVKELSNIVSDLAKAQVVASMKDQQVDERLKEIALRLERLERSKS